MITTYLKIAFGLGEAMIGVELLFPTLASGTIRMPDIAIIMNTNSRAILLMFSLPNPPRTSLQPMCYLERGISPAWTRHRRGTWQGPVRREHYHLTTRLGAHKASRRSGL